MSSAPPTEALLRRLRDDTPAAAERIHLNNAGAALMPAPVVRAVREHVELESWIGGYEAADARRDAIDATYASVARLLDCQPSNVALMENATAAFVAALSAIRFQAGDVLLTTRHDYVSNQIQYLALAERLGVEVVRAPDAPEGGVDVQAMDELIHRRRPALVAVTQVPTNSGLVQDVEAIGRLCRRTEVPYLVDACQSVGQMEVHPEALGADFLSATARKFLRGPRGIGFLYVSERALEAGLEPLFPDLRAADWVADDLYQPAPDATRFENWEFPYALVLGLGAAADYATALDARWVRDRARALADRLRRGLEGMPGVRVLDRAPELCAIVTAHLGATDPARAVDRLRERGVNTSLLTRSGAVLDFDAKGVEAALRLSPHYYNTEDEVDRALEALQDLVEVAPSTAS